MSAALVNPSVLIAEDSTDTRDMLKRAFEIKGYRVYVASNGQEAIDITRQYAPNLIVVDLNMPVLDGLAMVKYVRELKGPSEQVPIVAITAYDVYGMEEAARETGCNGYLSKPFDLKELDRVLRSLGFVV